MTVARCGRAMARCVDLIIGITVALPDGTLAKSGGKVVKNVAGYDLAKLFAGRAGNARASSRKRSSGSILCPEKAAA